MKFKAIAINPRDGFDLVAIWQKDGTNWHLLELARPQRAIALYWENPKARLVFPTEVNPNHVKGRISTRNRGNNYSVGAKG